MTQITTSPPPVTQMMTMDLRQRPGLEKQTHDLLAPADAMQVDQSLDAETLVPVAASPPPAPMVAPGMQRRSTYSATVVDMEALVLAVAGQILLDRPGSTKVTQRWLSQVCRPSPQATLGLLTASAPALNALARALKHDLRVPGTTLSETTTLVSTS
jgi:hypothetical protein